MPKLENWDLVILDGKIIQLSGDIYNDEKKRFNDGTRVRTSKIQSFDMENKTAKTLNTSYELGKPSKELFDWIEENGYDL